MLNLELYLINSFLKPSESFTQQKLMSSRCTSQRQLNSTDSRAARVVQWLGQAAHIQRLEVLSSWSRVQLPALATLCYASPPFSLCPLSCLPFT